MGYDAAIEGAKAREQPLERPEDRVDAPHRHYRLHRVMQNNNSDIVDVVGVTPVPSPLPSSAADPPPAPPTDEGGGSSGNDDDGNAKGLRAPEPGAVEERVDIVEGAAQSRATVSSSTPAETGYSSPPSSFYEEEGEEGRPSLPHPSLPRSAPEESANIDEDDDSRIRCICENEEDDGFTIQCDGCLVWQHAVCVGIARHNVPETFLCEECRPTGDTAMATPVAVLGAARKATKRKRASSSSHSTLGSAAATATGTISNLPALNEITSNIVATEALATLRQLAGEYERVRLRMPRLSRDIPLGQVNFELCPGMVALPSREDLIGALKATEVRELRGRNYGRRAGSSLARIGVFAAEDFDPGAIVGEYLGHVQSTHVLRGRRPESVTQSHILFSAASPGLIVDARKFGSALRYIRRSCRANCEVKVVLLPPHSEDVSECVHWCLFARNTIREGEELFLPFDYGSDGNHYFRYECCCLYPELCLADDMQSGQLIDVTGSGVGSGAGTTSIGERQHPYPYPHPHPHHGQHSKRTGGISSSLLSPDHRRGGGLVSTAQAATSRSRTTATAAAAAGAPDRKLSREERKLQQYIEFIERMELAEKRQAGRRSASGAGSSHSGAASPPPSGTAPSPRKGSLTTAAPASASGQRASSLTSSKTTSPPKKPKVAGDGGGEGGEKEGEGTEEEKRDGGKGSSIEPASPGPNKHAASIPAKAKINFKAGANDDAAILAPTALPSPTPAPKRVLPLKKFLVRNFEDRRASGIGSSGSSSFPESPVKQSPRDASVGEGGRATLTATRTATESAINEDEVDVMAVDGTDSEGSASGERGRPREPHRIPTDPRVEHPQLFDPDEHHDHAGGGGAPETPSKKRVSLSDYLLRRKSSPVEKIQASPKESMANNGLVPGGGGETTITSQSRATNTKTTLVAPYIKEDPYPANSAPGEVPTFIKPAPVEETVAAGMIRRVMSPLPPSIVSPTVPYTLPASSPSSLGPWSQHHPSHHHHHHPPSVPHEASRRESYPVSSRSPMDSLGSTQHQRQGSSSAGSSPSPSASTVYHPPRRPNNHGEGVRDRYGDGVPNDHRVAGGRMGAGDSSNALPLSRPGGDYRGRGRDPREARDYGPHRDYRHPPRDHYHYHGGPPRGGDTRDHSRMDPRNYNPGSNGSAGGGRPAGSVSPRSPPPSPYAGGDRPRPPPLPPLQDSATTQQYSAAHSSSATASASATFSRRGHHAEDRLH